MVSISDPGAQEFFDSLNERHREARTELEAGLRSDRYKELLETLVAAANEPRLTAEAYGPSSEVLPPLVGRTWKKLKKKGRALTPGSSDHDFHQVRIGSKRARYAAEAVAPALGEVEEGASRFASKAAEVQEVLGAHQDAVVGQQLFEDFAEEHPENGPLNLTMGRLIEREEHEGRATKDRFFDVWKELDRKKNRRWFRN